MKSLVIFVLLGALLITAGCVGGNKETAVPSTPTPQIVYATVTPTPVLVSPVVQVQDPIIGTWRFNTRPGSDILQFDADGSVVEIFVPGGPGLTGTWTAVPGGNYQVNWGGINVQVFAYDPARDGIYPFSDPSRLYTPYPAGEPAGSSSLPGYIPVSTLQPSYGSIHFSGNGNDVKTFTATGSGIRVFSISYPGPHYFLVTLTDSEGAYVDTLADTTGSFSGKKPVLLRTGEYVLDIAASGPWTIDILLV